MTNEDKAKKNKKQGEQKLNPVLDIEIPFGANDSELQEASYHIPEGFHAEIKDNKVFIKKGEYKPAWSEEDEWKFSDILALLRGGENYRYNTPELFAWLKSIKDKLQPKREWSEEDEKKIMWLVRLISTAGFRELDNDKMPCSRSELIDWLKSLRPQNTWKPSKEQMEALYDSIPQNVMEISKKEMLLDSLYIDLKKL